MDGEKSSGMALAPRSNLGLPDSDNPAMTIDLDQSPDRAVERSVSLFGQRLMLDRRAAGLTRTDLSDRTGISASYVARIESGRANPTLDTMVKLADALGVDLADMLLPRPEAVSHRTAST